MPDDPVDDVRRLLAHEGVGASDTELRYVAMLGAIRRRNDPQPETEPHLTLSIARWKPR